MIGAKILILNMQEEDWRFFVKLVSKLSKEFLLKNVDLNLIFNHWITQKLPFIVGKMAITLDGKFAAASDIQSGSLASQRERMPVRWRRYFPAIAVSATQY